MPFKSESQRRLFWAKVGRGEISRKTAEEWESHTPKKKRLPERMKQEKRSQVGSSPAAAVSGNTPTVQATAPMNMPTTPSAESTVTKVGQVMYAAWADEFEKLAAPRWKQILRAGGLGAEELGKLTKADLLNYGKEVTGLERGTEALIKKHNLPPVYTPLSEEGKKQLLTSIADKAKRLKASEALKDARTYLSSRLSELTPGMSTPIGTHVNPKLLHSAFGSEEASPLGRRAIEAITMRHEADEALARKKFYSKVLTPKRMLESSIGAKPLPAGGWAFGGGVPTELPPDMKSYMEFAQGLVTGQAKAARVKGQSRGRILKRMHSVPVVGRKLHALGQQMETSAPLIERRALSSIPSRRLELASKGQAMTGMHINPDVITRESSHVATMPPEAQEAFSRIRGRAGAEQEHLGPYGFRYGTATPPKIRRAIMKAFERGEI